MKTKEKNEAIRLRSEEGLSIGDIANQLKVSKSSVSIWVRDVNLTEDQQQILNAKNPVFSRYYEATERRSETFREIRRQYQTEGRKLLHSLDSAKKNLMIAGCMLYWAEGSKKKNVVDFGNSDANMMKYFLFFLKEVFDIIDDDISLSINCYTDMYTLEDIENYWLSFLSLPKKCCRKHTVNYYSSYSYKKRKGKLPYGVCRIAVHSTEIIQKIYGVIQEIGYFEEDGKWLQ